ncbi:MAG: hypothetical protein KF767_17820 [Bdellovibrionaceae bacterium]|nr:hypothetical protein [Pseudobdellovibrionaceae bacterium]
MRTLIASLLFMLSAVASAHPVVNDSGSLYCQLNSDSRFPPLKIDELAVTENGTRQEFSRVKTEKFLFDLLAGWVDTLISSKDPLFVNRPKPLCVGLYDDSTGANAVAIGDGQIAFGAVLVGRTLRTFMDSADYALTYVNAHEFAHILQARLGLRFDYGAPGMRLDLLSTKIKELHADCMAGYLLEVHRQIPFTHQARLESFVRTLGDSHAVGDHGMPADRTAALQEGARLANLDRVVGLTQIHAASAASKCGLKYRPQSF